MLEMVSETTELFVLVGTALVWAWEVFLLRYINVVC